MGSQRAGALVAGPEGLRGRREGAQSSWGRGEDGSCAGAQMQAWAGALTTLPTPVPTLAHPGSAHSHPGPVAFPKLSQPQPAPESRVPQLLRGLGAEPQWGLMGDGQAPLNRILIIQLQQEFFPPWAWALTDTSISTSASSQPWQPAALPGPTACPHHCGGLWPFSWGSGRAWHLPPAIMAWTLDPGERFAQGAPLRSAPGTVHGQN